MLDYLKEQALEACNFRGHVMGKWRDMGDTRAIAVCKYCGKTVVVNSNPLPNEADITGSAVAVSCEGS